MITNYFKNKIKPCNSIANFPSKKKCSTEAVNCTQISLHVAAPCPRTAGYTQIGLFQIYFDFIL